MNNKILEGEKEERSKYWAKKIEFEGIMFDSQLELSFYKKLRDQGITVIERQTKFVLQEAFRIEKELIREIAYKADFLIEWCWHKIYIDSKGMETPEFKIKHKMWLHKYRDTHKLIVTGSFTRLMLTLNAIKDSTQDWKELEGAVLINTRKPQKAKRKKKDSSGIKEKTSKA